MSVQHLLDQFLGGQKGSEPAPEQPATGLAAKAGGMLQSIPGGAAGGLAAGSLLGLIAGNKKVRKTAGNLAGGAATIGGAAALGALAFKAYQGWQGSGSAQPNTSTDQHASSEALGQDNFAPEAQMAANGEAFPVALVKAMIAAANADGHIDADEQATIFTKVEEMELDAEHKALIFDTLQNPPRVEDIAQLANGVEQACELYLVSRMAIDPDDPREQAYLQALAGHLSLPEGLADQLDQQIAQPRPMAA